MNITSYSGDCCYGNDQRNTSDNEHQSNTSKHGHQSNTSENRHQSNSSENGHQSNTGENGFSDSCDSNFSNACNNKLQNISDNRISETHDQIELSNTCDSILGNNMVNKSDTSEPRHSPFQAIDGIAASNEYVSNHKRIGKACRQFLWKATRHDRPYNLKSHDIDVNNMNLKQLSETTKSELKKLSATFEGKWGNVSDSLFDNAANGCNDQNLDSNKTGHLCDNRHSNNSGNVFVATHAGESSNHVGGNGFGNACNTLNNNLTCNTTQSGFNNACHKLSFNHDADVSRNVCHFGAEDRCDNNKSVKNVNIEPGDILDALHSDNISDFNLDLLKDMSQNKASTSLDGHNSYSSNGNLLSCYKDVELENHVTPETGLTQKGAGFHYRNYYTALNNYDTQPVFPSNM